MKIKKKMTYDDFYRKEVDSVCMMMNVDRIFDDEHVLNDEICFVFILDILYLIIDINIHEIIRI